MSKGIKQFDLPGKRALVTGSSQGIGLTLAKGLSDAGASVVLNGRDTDKLSKAAKQLSDDGASVYELPFDVTDHAAVVAAIASYESDQGPIDILINNAGMQHRSPLHEFEPDMFAQLLRTNVSLIFNVGQVVARYMIERGRARSSTSRLCKRR